MQNAFAFIQFALNIKPSHSLVRNMKRQRSPIITLNSLPFSGGTKRDNAKAGSIREFLLQLHSRIDFLT